MAMEYLLYFVLNTEFEYIIREALAIVCKLTRDRNTSFFLGGLGREKYIEINNKINIFSVSTAVCTFVQLSPRSYSCLHVRTAVPTFVQLSSCFLLSPVTKI